MDTEEEAKAVIARLNKGIDFGVIAQELSLDTSTKENGGDLGWFTTGSMVQAFEDAAWSLEIGEISEPVKTDYGYHIIQVLGHEVRQLTDSELETFKTNNFSKFIEAAKAELTVKKFDIWANVVPSLPAIPDQYRIADTTTGQ